MVKILISTFLAITLASANALACIGTAETSDLSFRNGHEPGQMIVTLTSSDGKVRELVDDTGYLSVDLALTQLNSALKKSGDTKVETSSPTLEFLRGRLSFMKASLTAGLDAEKEKEQLEKLTKAIDQFTAIANSRDVVFQDLNTAFSAIGRVLYDSKLEVTAQMRTDTKAPFDKEKPLRLLKLPSRIMARGGCNEQIGKFSFGAPGAAPAAANPAGGASAPAR